MTKDAVSSKTLIHFLRGEANAFACGDWTAFDETASSVSDHVAEFYRKAADHIDTLESELASLRHQLSEAQYRNVDGDLYTAAQLADLLHDRDAFLGSKGLFDEYAKQAGAALTSSQENAG